MIKLNNQAGQDGYIFHFHLKFSNPLEVLRTHITNQIFVWTYGLTSLGEKIRGVYMQDLG